MGDTTLDGLIRAAFDHMIGDVRVALPGRIESFDRSDRTATVKPMISVKRRGATEPTELPIIQGVPVVEPRTQKAALSLPIAAGDPVLLVFADRALENWLGSAGTSPSGALDVRKHHIADAFAIPGGWPTGKNSTTPAPTGLGIEVGLEVGTKIAFGNGVVELVDLISQILSLLATDTVSGVPLLNAGQYAALKVLLDQNLTINPTIP